MTKIAELDGYQLHTGPFGYRIEEPEANYGYSSYGLMTVLESENTVGVYTISSSNRNPAAVAEYAHALLNAVKVANYFQAVIDDREN